MERTILSTFCHCKVQSMCWVQFLFILVSQNSPKSKLKLALLSAVEQSGHPTLGPDASKASCYSSRLSKEEMTPPSRKCESEALVLSVSAAVFCPQRQERGLLSLRWHKGSSNTPPVYILSKSNCNCCPQQLQFRGDE